jgi:hypothetical protein
MAESVIPGTYITVRAEGLISAGRIATGIVGVIGTAASGPVGVPVTLSGFGNAREIFGSPDNFNLPEDGAHPLTLVRALEHIYANGASSVVAVRVAGGSSLSASYAVLDKDKNKVAVLTAKTSGTWGNGIHVDVEPADDDCRIEGETHTGTAADTFDNLTYSPIVDSKENQLRIFRGTTRRVETPTLEYKRVVRDEQVERDANNKYILARNPIEPVAKINHVRIVDSTGGIHEYGDGNILYDVGKLPSAKEIRINAATGEITLESSLATPADQKLSIVATYAVAHDAPTAGHVLITTWDGTLAFAEGEAPQETDGDRLVATYLVDRRDCVRVSLTDTPTVERYITPDGRVLAQLVGASSHLVTAEPDKTYGDSLPQATASTYFGTGSNTPGNNGADAGKDEYQAGLAAIENELINIVVLAGQNATDMRDVLEGHLNRTAETDHERIGVIGAQGASVAEFLGHPLAHERVIVVAPGLKFKDKDQTVELPAAYTAAAVAGLISSVDVQTSLTNKVLNVPGLALDVNRGQQEQLIRRNVLAVVWKEGYRVLKGITTSGEGTPFAAIPTRRIVDYARYGVRSGANPYLGRLNNIRVRAALKSTLDAFLTRMVEDEALTGYELEVTAIRAQEIAGEVSVVMIIQPTFSIDYIKVTMILR